MPASDTDTDAAELQRGLRAQLQARGSAWSEAPFERLRDKGLAHHHVRLVGTGVLARIPKQSQLRLGARDNLAYQAACFERIGPLGHAPRLMGLLPPGPDLPRGALLVEEIVGRSAQLPGDLPAIMQALASIHALPLPPPTRRAPLLHARDPLQDLRDEIAAQAQHLDSVGLAPAAASDIGAELQRLGQVCARLERPARHLVAFDGHPGNFIVRSDGSAALVDLEKCRYSYPGLDLAHATLYTSTTWDLDSCTALDPLQVAQGYAAWAGCVGAAAARSAQPWHAPLRRAMWLWSVTWCAKWRALSGVPAGASADGEDWSAQGNDAALTAHVQDRVAHYLSAAVVQQLRHEFSQFDQALVEPTNGS